MTAPAPTYGGYSETEMRHVLQQACRTVGLDSEGAEVLRGHTNAVVRLRHNPVVVKIARRGSRYEDVERTVRFVQWLMDLGFPTSPLHDVPQPTVIDGHSTTFWTYLPQPEVPVTAQQLAEPLHALHNLPSPPMHLPEHDTVAAIGQSIAAAYVLPAATRTFLSERLERLTKELDGIDFLFPETVIQGDPQHRNALHASPTVVLCDWDTVTLGHREWDLATIEIHCRRFQHGAEQYRPFVDSYGFDITTWPGFAVIRDLRELRMICTNARKIASAPHTRSEVERRIDGLRQEDTSMLWNIL
ncbi:phosphotransferase family protein [Streptomyces marianii]|uniref:Aminoglycoside phosphotransferase family protein n=1 Tax=Streptomyces marianii TaxID=1817406 RepID=A0A5R9EBD3_9ACTN|nr:aminoglycoside phosphotransferase family protein [Streptomyces marianii]TLQ46062.1 aminoglycoside phosphotransferase family protein [Streptomyces marianii]